jgi:predicted ArsR family transcriptional regulator
LRMLLDVLMERLLPFAVDDAVREVGHRVAAGQTVPIGELRDRVDQALAVLAELGGLAEAEEREDGFLIRGASCPLAAALPGHPEVCHLAETLLSDLVGVPVAECCQRGDQPRCCFAVSAPTA